MYLSVLAFMVRVVKRVLKVRMLPTEDQAAALKATLRTCNEAASWLSGRVHADRVRRKHDIQKRFYAELKGRFTVVGTAGDPGDRQGGRCLQLAARQY